jgi:hypothetical protein
VANQAPGKARNCKATPMSRFALLTLLLISLASPSVAAAEITVSQLLADALAFDGRHVTVSGTAQSVKPVNSPLGHEYETFRLCEQSCVKVFAVGHPHITEGERITVNGNFQADTSFGPFVLHEEILEDEGSP